MDTNTNVKAPVPPSRVRLWAIRIGLVVFGFVFVIGSLEIAGHIYFHFKYGVPGKSYGIHMLDDELGATLRPNSYNSNSIINNFGFRDVEDISEKKPAGATRIYCSGGSTTFCYNLNTEDSWPHLLQQKLRQVKGHERDEVLNAGQIGFGVSQELVLAKRFIPRLKPDIVLLFTGLNEFSCANTLVHRDNQDLDRLLAEERWGVCPKNLDQVRFLKRHSVLVRLIDYRVKKMLESRLTAEFHENDETPRPIHPWISANFDHTMKEYFSLLHANGCKVIVIRFGDTRKENWYTKQFIRVYRDRAVEIGKEQGATICDLVPAVENYPRRSNLFIDSGIHVTREGAELYSDVLKKEILTLTTEVAAR
jgi:hypothetical protein